MNSEQIAYARMVFELRVHNSNGSSYEELFTRVMYYRDPDFQQVKAWGSLGDKKNDGFVRKTGKYFQVYAPDDITKNYPDAVKKLEDDFQELYEYWGDVCEYYFVINDKYRGVNAEASQAMNRIKTRYSLRNGEILTAKDIERFVFDLPEDMLISIIGTIPEINCSNPTRNSENLSLFIGIGSPLRLIDLSGNDIASKSDARIYFEGSIPNFKIITSNIDIERDDQPELLHNLNDLNDESKMVLILGSVGTGKSTLGMRTAYDYAKSTEGHLIQVRDNQNPNVWRQLEDITNEINKPITIFVDDAFRDSAFVDAFMSFHPKSGVNIVATSRTNEYPSYFRPNFRVIKKVLERPSETEMKKVFSTFNITDVVKQKYLLRRFKRIDSWLILMLEITKNENLKRTIHDGLNRLKKQDEIVFRAFAYVSFVGQFELTIPKKLFERLDSKGEFYKICELQASKGYIFEYKSNGNTIGCSHHIVAKESFRSINKDPKIILSCIINSVELGSDEDLNFVARLLFKISKRWSVKEFDSVIDSTKVKLAQIIQASRIQELINIWVEIYKWCNQFEVVDQIFELIDLKSPVSNGDWFAIYNLTLTTNNVEKIKCLHRTSLELLTTGKISSYPLQLYIESIRRVDYLSNANQVIDYSFLWIHDNPFNISCRNQIINLVIEKGSLKQVEKAITTTKEMFKDGVPDENTIVTLCCLLERRGNAIQRNDFIQFTNNQIKIHGANYPLTAKYIKFVSVNGHIQLVETVLTIAELWLEEHENDISIRKTILSILKSKGQNHFRKRFIANTIKWLDKNPDNSEIRSVYVSLVAAKEPGEMFNKMIIDIGKWLEIYYDAVEVRRNYVKSISKYGSGAEKVKMFNESVDWLMNGYCNFEIVKMIVISIGQNGNKEIIEKLKNPILSWFSKNTALDLQNEFNYILNKYGLTNGEPDPAVIS